MRRAVRRARVSPEAWLDAVEDYAAGFRADRRRTITAVAAVLAAHRWSDGCSMPTWATLIADTGRCRSVVARTLRELLAEGLLLRVESGSTVHTRPFSDEIIEGNRAAVYGLVLPVDENRTPQGNLYRDCQYTRARPDERAAYGSRDQHQPPTPPRQRHVDHTTVPPRPTTRRERLEGARQLQSLALPLYRLSTPTVRHLARTWWDRGWTTGDIAWALNHHPDSTPWIHTSDVNQPAGWFTHRMRAWTHVPSPSQQRASALADQRAEQAQARADRAATEAAACAPTSSYQAARADLVAQLLATGRRWRR